MLLKNNPVENTIYSNGVYPLLVASLGLGTLSLGQIGAANIRIWEVLIGAFVMTVFINLLLGKKFVSPNRMAVIILLPFMGCVLLSGLNADRLDLWAKQTLLLVAMLALFVIVSQRWSRVQIVQNLPWIIYPGILIAGWGVLEMLLFPENLPFYHSENAILPRARSLFAEANEFSQFLTLPFGFLFSAMLYHRKVPSWERWVFGLGLLLIVSVQLLSYSRGGLVAFASEILAWFILTSIYGIGERRRFRVRNVMLLFLILSIAVGSLLDGPAVSNMIDALLERVQSLFSGNDVTSQIRWEGIVAAVSNTVNWPVTFAVGVGLGNLPLILGDGVATTANLLVDVFSELGVLGLLSFLIILGAALILPLNTLKYLARKKDDEMLAVFFGAYLSFVGLVVGGLTYATHMLNFFWFTCGLLFALYQYKKTSVANEGRNIKNDHD